MYFEALYYMCTMVLVFYYPVLRTTYIHMYMYYTYIEIIHTYIDLDLLVIFVPERASVHSSSMVPGTATGYPLFGHLFSNFH